MDELEGKIQVGVTPGPEIEREDQRQESHENITHHHDWAPLMGAQFQDAGDIIGWFKRCHIAIISDFPFLW